MKKALLFCYLNLFSVLAWTTAREAAPSVTSPAASEIFERRILPIFNSPNPSSCTECHLAGVDLKNYILSSSEKTFLSLRDQQLIDFDQPEKSKILQLISMGRNVGAELIPKKVREQEYDAFHAWIMASTKDARLRSAPKLELAEIGGPKRPLEVIRHARRNRVLESLVVNVWSQRQRCLYCHASDGGGNSKLIAEHGEEITWLRTSPEETLRFLAASKLINTNEPAKSLLLLKPINEIAHEGGQKMLVGDMAYKGFRTWLEDYARTIKDQYSQASDLPADGPAALQIGSRIRLQISNTPPSWAEQMLQVNVHAWDQVNETWEADPIAISDRAVWGKGKLWAHELWLLAPAGSVRARAWQAGTATIPSGRYQIRVFLDSEGKLQRNWEATLGPMEFIGQTELNAEWSGEKVTMLEARDLRR